MDKQRLLLADSLGFLGFQMNADGSSGEVWKAHPDLNLDIIHTTSVPPIPQSGPEILSTHNFFAERIREQKRLTFVNGLSDIQFDGTTSVVCGIQMPPPPEDAKMLGDFKKAGIHFTTIAYSHKNEYGGGCLAPEEPLTSIGLDFLSQCADAGIVLDVSHAGRATVADILEADIEGLEICATHTGLWDVCRSVRNLDFECLYTIAARKGYIGIPAMTWLYSESGDTLEGLYNHLLRVWGDIGRQFVGIGSDLVYWPNPPDWRIREERMKNRFDPEDRFGIRVPCVPVELQDSVNKMEKIAECVIRKTLLDPINPDETIRLLCGESFSAYLRNVL